MHLRSILFLITLSFSFNIYSQQQDTIENYLLEQLRSGNHDKVTEAATDLDPGSLSGSALYHIGLSYYKQQQDSLANLYFNRSIDKNPYFSEVYYYNGLIYNYHKLYDPAIRHFKAALRLDPDEGDYMEGLAEAYYFSGQRDSAFVYLIRSIQYGNTRPDVYLKLADIHRERGEDDAALDIYYECLYKADPASELFNDCLYNIGFYEYERGNYEDAELALRALLDRDPNDHKAIEKQIQTFFKLNKGARIQSLRQRLYEGYRKNELPESMKEMYCFDEFTYKNNLIKACERFADINTGVARKHVFHVFDETGSNLLYILYTEQDDEMRRMNNSYYLSQVINGEYRIYRQLQYNSVIDYSKLMKDVRSVINGKESPTTVKQVEE